MFILVVELANYEALRHHRKAQETVEKSSAAEATEAEDYGT